jgi:hypothetical protein
LPDVPAAPGASITLQFDLPDGGGAGSLLKVTGVVVSDALAGTFRRTGVRFHGVAEETIQRINRFCQQLDQANRGELAGDAVASG